MKRIKSISFLTMLLVGSLFAVVPDYRPAFEKSSYQKTIWTQSNLFYAMSKERVVDSFGGPNYAFKEYHSAGWPARGAWGEPIADLCKNGTINIQAELHVRAPLYANTMKDMLKQVREQNVDTKFSIFLCYYGEKNVDDDIQRTIAQLEMLQDELKNDPLIFRMDGCPVISVYTAGYFKPEEWGRVIPEVEKKCGKFIWLMNTCRGPALDSDKEKCSEWVRSLLPYFDGVSQYANYSETSQQAHYEILAPIMHNEYPQKIFEVALHNVYCNHFHMAGVATHLSRKWRKSIESALAAKPDAIVMTNHFDHYENSLIQPCYEREDFLTRYASAALAEWNGQEFVADSTPELVVTNYTTILLGSQNLDFEVIGFPIASQHKEITLTLDVCDTSGELLFSFPPEEMDLSTLSVKEFSIPSEQFPNVRGIVPRLRYLWRGQELSMPFGPMTFISPSLRTNWMFWARSTKNLRQCLVVDPKWTINEIGADGLVKWPEDGIITITSQVKAVFKNDPQGRDRGGFFRIMRNGLQWYRLAARDGNMYFSRTYNIPPPADALNWYHLEYENANGYKYATLPIWMSSGRRHGSVLMPILCGEEIRNVSIEAQRIPFFYYPCERDDGALLVDHSGYMHNGTLAAQGYGGGHLGYTGYHYYHNGGVNPIKESLFHRDPDGNGMLRLDGKNFAMIMGGTAFPGASTYEIEVRPTSIGEKMGVLGTANKQINLWIEPNGHVKASRGSGQEGIGGSKPVKNFLVEITSKTKLESGRWYHLAVVYDLQTLRLYINGQLEAEVSVEPTRDHFVFNHITVGSLCRWHWTPHTYFIGDLRQIRFYGRNLSPAEFMKHL